MVKLGLSDNVKLIGSKDMLLCKPKSKDENNSKSHLLTDIVISSDDVMNQIDNHSDLPILNTNKPKSQDENNSKSHLSTDIVISSDDVMNQIDSHSDLPILNTNEIDCQTKPKVKLSSSNSDNTSHVYRLRQV